MSVASKVAYLPHLLPPVLTAYVDVNPGNPRNQSTPRGYLRWLKSAGRALGREVNPESRKAFRAHLQRMTRHLETFKPRGRALVLFSGPKVWEEISLQVDVADELHWGKPSLQQMAWLLNEHRPRGVVVLDGDGARFFRFYLGAVSEDSPYSFSIDLTYWKKPYLVGPSTPRVAKQSGVERDRVAARVAQQRKHFLTGVSRRITEWAQDAGVNPVVLIGNRKDIEAIRSSVSGEFRRSLVSLPKVLSQTSSPEISKRLQPLLYDWEREYEKNLVSEIIGSEGSEQAVVGLDETLDQLQRGQVGELVIARALKGSAKRCTKCGWVDRSEASECPLCGSRRETRTLRTLLPELAGEHSVAMEVVAGAAAGALSTRGGISAWLRTARRRPTSSTNKALLFKAS